MSQLMKLKNVWYSLAPHTDVSVNDRPHIRPWSHKIIILKVKLSRYRPGVAQRAGRCISLLFHDRGTRRGWVVSSTPRPHFTTGKEPVPILLEAGWDPGPVWTGVKFRPHRDSIPDRSQSLYWLSYPVHNIIIYYNNYHCVTIAYSIQYSSMLYRFVT